MSNTTHTNELALSTGSRNYYITHTPQMMGEVYRVSYYSVKASTGKEWQGIKFIKDWEKLDASWTSPLGATYRGYSSREKAMNAINEHASK
jgi:hypothetical protein